MRRVLNLKVVLVSLSVLVISALAVHFLHGVQVGRSGRANYDDALRFEADGDLVNAAKMLKRYIAFEQGDLNALEKYGDVLGRLATRPVEKHSSFLVLEQVLSRDPKREALRRRAIALALELHLFPDAIRHLDLLVKDHPEEAELEASMGRCHETVGNFDDAAVHYDQALKLNPRDASTSLQFAGMTKNHPGNGRDVETILDRFVEANPDSSRAYLERGLRKMTSDPAAASRDLAKARELAPENIDVLFGLGKLELARQDVKSARAIWEKGRALHPKDYRFYIELSRLDLQAGRRDSAEAMLVNGIAACESVKELQWTLANLYFDQNQQKEAEALVADLRERKAPASALILLEARREMGREHWKDAVRTFKTLGSQYTVTSMPVDVVISTNLYIGRCHDQLGEYEQSVQAYRLARDADPGSVLARLGLAGALNRLGRKSEALDIYRLIVKDVPAVRLPIAQIMTETTLKQPEARRNWKPVEALLDEAEKSTADATEVALTRATVLSAQGRRKEADERIEAIKQNQPKRVEPWLFQAEVLMRQGKGDEALSLLDRASATLGDRVELRMARAQYWAARGGPKALEALKPLEADVAKFSRAEQGRMLRSLSVAYERLGLQNEAFALWLRLTELDPDASDIQLAVLKSALDQGDDALAAKASAAVLNSDGEDGPYSAFAAALPLLAAARRGEPGKLVGARVLLQKASAAKPGWPSPLLALAEASELSGERDQILKNRMAAIEAGVRDTDLIRKTIALLYVSRRFDDAERLLRSLGTPTTLPGSLRRAADGLSLRNDSLDHVLAKAREAVAKGSKDPADYVWLTQLLAASNQKEEIVPLLRKAIAIDEKRPDTWIALTAYLSRAGLVDDAKIVVEAARPKLLAAKQGLALASCYEMTRSFEKSDEIFREALRADPEDPVLIRGFAEYSLRRGKTADSDTALTRLLALRKKAPSQASWARRSLLFGKCQGVDDSTLEGILGEFRNESQDNIDLENERMADQRAVALVLAGQPSRPRRKEAIALLQGVADKNYTSADDEFLLAQLHEEQGNGRRARELIDRLSSQERDNPRYLAYRSRLLIRQGRHALAQNDISRLKELAPKDPLTAELEARWLAADGKVSEAVDLLEKAMADKSASLRFRSAAVFEQIGGEPGLKAAETILKSASEVLEPPFAGLELSLFLSRRGRLEDAIAAWEKARTKTPKATAVVAALSLASAPGVTDDQRETLATWVEGAVKAEPTSAGMTSSLAVLRESQGRFDDAESLYRKAIELDPRSVIALNNLACITALRGVPGEEALQMVDRAIAVSGPMPALLDTRALALLSLGRNDSAIKDLEAALEVTPTSNRLFHQARALLLNGDRLASVRAYEKALKAGLKTETLHPLERPKLAELVAAIRPQ